MEFEKFQLHFSLHRFSKTRQNFFLVSLILTMGGNTLLSKHGAVVCSNYPLDIFNVLQQDNKQPCQVYIPSVNTSVE